MNEPATRTDKAHEIRYPSSPDARGSARVHHLRRPYYLGPFESPQSYILFGLWKQRLVETGEAPSPKDLRPMLDSILSQGETRQPGWLQRWSVPLMVMALAYSLVATGLAAKFLLTEQGPQVDDIKLTVNETEVVRGLRDAATLRNQKAEIGNSQIAAITRLLREGKPKNANPEALQGKNF